MTSFSELPEFGQEFKRLAKKYKSLSDDLAEFKRIVNKVPLGNGKHFKSLTQTEDRVVIKARFFCRYLKGTSLRIIYAFHSQNESIVFLEIYFKGEKTSEDKQRIKEYLKLLAASP